MVSPLREGETELFTIRDASLDDISFMVGLYQESLESSLVGCLRETPVWEYEMLRRGTPAERTQHRVIVDGDGNRIGFLLHAPTIEDGALLAYRFHLVPGASYLDVTPGVLRYLASAGESYSAQTGAPYETLSLGMEASHPIHRLTRDMLQRTNRPYAWYIRLPDLPSFIARIVPILRQRVENSFFPGYSGTLHIGFFEDSKGLFITFTQGAITRVGLCQAERFPTAMPFEHFVKLLFGYRSVEELDEDYPEVQLTNMSRLLLETLFPKMPSSVLSIC